MEARTAVVCTCKLRKPCVPQQPTARALQASNMKGLLKQRQPLGTEIPNHPTTLLERDIFTIKGTQGAGVSTWPGQAVVPIPYPLAQPDGG
jgi:hypothetical protein